jgi:predicted peptidase
MGTKELQQKEHFKKDVVMSVDIKYLLYLPKDYNSTGKPFPLIIFLHGAGERGDNLDRLKVAGIPKVVETDSNFPFVAISPQCPANTLWIDHLESLKLLIDNIKGKYNIDKSRVYLTGLSLGGFGTWALAAKYPNDFAAIAPICGGGDAFLANSYKMPIWVFHGAKDDIIPIKRSQEMVDAIKATGGNVKFTIYPELGHSCYVTAYNDPNLYKWFLEQKK